MENRTQYFPSKSYTPGKGNCRLITMMTGFKKLKKKKSNAMNRVERVNKSLGWGWGLLKKAEEGFTEEVVFRLGHAVGMKFQ